MHRVLKPDGKIITEDLLVETMPFTELVKLVLNGASVKENKQGPDPFCYLDTPEAYKSLLSNAGFVKVDFRDNTKQLIICTEIDIERIKNNSQSFTNELGEETYNNVLTQWLKFINALRAHELISGFFNASKKTSS